MRKENQSFDGKKIVDNKVQTRDKALVSQIGDLPSSQGSGREEVSARLLNGGGGEEYQF